MSMISRVREYCFTNNQTDEEVFVEAYTYDEALAYLCETYDIPDDEPVDEYFTLESVLRYDENGDYMEYPADDECDDDAA